MSEYTSHHNFTRTISITMTKFDFDRLWVMGAEWNNTFIEQQDMDIPEGLRRFEVITCYDANAEEYEDGEFPWEPGGFAYFFETWAETILARAWLIANGFSFYLMHDNTFNGGVTHYVLVTEHADTMNHRYNNQTEGEGYEPTAH